MYCPFIWDHDYLCRGGYEARSSLIYPPDVSSHRCRPALNIDLIWELKHRMISWSRAVSLHMDTLVWMSLHTSSTIHMFLLASRDLGFGISLQRSANILYYLVGVVRGRRGSRVLHPRYFVCYLRVPIWRQPSIK